MKKVLVISSSLRPGSNSEALADAFIRGAAEAGNEVEKITLKEKEIRFCKGCLACQQTQRCVIADDAPAIVAKMHDADVLAFASPIYYYEMCGQLKTLLDRANPLYPSGYRFRDIYMLTSAAEEGAHVPERVSGRRASRERCSPAASPNRAKRKGTPPWSAPTKWGKR